MEGQGDKKMSREQEQGEERERKQGESVNVNRNYISGDLANGDDTQDDLGASMKPPVQSWVQKKRASFELMCASRSDGFRSAYKPDYFVSKSYKEKGDTTPKLSETKPYMGPIIAESIQIKETILEDISETEEDGRYEEQPCNVILNASNEKNNGGIVSDSIQMTENTREELKGKKPCNTGVAGEVNEKKNYENVPFITKIGEHVSEPKKDSVYEHQPFIEAIKTYVNEKINLKDSLETEEDSMNKNEQYNAVEASDLDYKNNDENVKNSFLSRDEAIKLSANASGTTQPRLLTITGSKLLIKDGGTDSACKEEGMEKIPGISVEKVSNTMNIIAEESEGSDQRITNILTKKYTESPNIPGKQAVIPTFGSKDPVVKKMVYNQYREMLRKYTQSSRL